MVTLVVHEVHVVPRRYHLYELLDVRSRVYLEVFVLEVRIIRLFCSDWDKHMLHIAIPFDLSRLGFFLGRDYTLGIVDETTF